MHVTTVKAGIAHPCNASSQFMRCTGNCCVATCFERCLCGTVRSQAVYKWLEPQVARTVRLSDTVHCRQQAEGNICIFEFHAACAAEVEVIEHLCKSGAGRTSVNQLAMGMHNTHA